MGAVGGGGHDLLRLRPVRPPDRRGRAGVPGRARAGHGDRPLVLPAQPRLQDEGEGLPRRRPTSPARPTTSASRSRRTSSSRSCPRTTAATTRSAAGEPVRQDRQAGLLRADDRPPDRPLPLPGRQLLHGPRRPHQLAAAPPGENDFADAVKTAVINKRAGGMGLISGRKAFQRPMAEGVKLLNAIQDVYLCKDVSVARSLATHCAGRDGISRAPLEGRSQVPPDPALRSRGRTPKGREPRARGPFLSRGAATVVSCATASSGGP